MDLILPRLRLSAFNQTLAIFHYRLRGLPGMNFTIQDNHRRQSAIPKATGNIYAQFPVGSRFSGLYIILLLKGFNDVTGAFYKTGGSHADSAGVFAQRLQVEKVI